MGFTIYEVKVLNRAKRVSHYLFWKGSMLQPVAVIYPEVIRELVAVVELVGEINLLNPEFSNNPSGLNSMYLA